VNISINLDSMNAYYTHTSQDRTLFQLGRIFEFFIFCKVWMGFTKMF